VVLSGSFPFMYAISKLFAKPFGVLGRRIGINETSMVGIISCLASNATTFGMMDKMDKKGVMLNSAFAVSGAFIFGSHMAFTLAFDSSYIAPVLVGKAVAGVLAIILAVIIYGRLERKESR